MDKRRILSILLVPALCLALSGCGGAKRAPSVSRAAAASSGRMAAAALFAASSAPSPAGNGSSGLQSGSGHSGIPVLCYHDIMLPAQKGSINNSLVITTDVFDREMADLKNAGYSVIGMEALRQYLTHGGDASKKVVLTFDDGYKQNAALAAPILRKYGFTATVFVIACHLDEPDQPVNLKTFFPLQYVSRKDVSGASDVLTFASHTYNMHVNLKNVENSAKIENDLVRSRQALGGTVYFAYPLGKYNARVENLLREAGFTMAFTTRRARAHPSESLLEIPRIEINAPLSDKSFRALMGIR